MTIQRGSMLFRTRAWSLRRFSGIFSAETPIRNTPCTGACEEAMICSGQSEHLAALVRAPHHLVPLNRTASHLQSWSVTAGVHNRGLHLSRALGFEEDGQYDGCGPVARG